MESENYFEFPFKVAMIFIEVLKTIFLGLKDLNVTLHNTEMIYRDNLYSSYQYENVYYITHFILYILFPTFDITLARNNIFDQPF